MNTKQVAKAAGKAAKAAVVTAGIAAAGYAALVVLNRMKYGEAGSVAGGQDSLLDWYLPEPEVREHHTIEIKAPADVVLETAKQMELFKSPIIRAIIRAREVAMGGEPDTRSHPTQLKEQMLSIGWVILAETPGREIVFGAVTQPWAAAPVFRSIPAPEFHDFAEPGWVKIAWTLRADPVDATRSVFTTETRVRTTDTAARERFRTYWSFVAPGVEVIRLVMLRPLRRAAEDRAARNAA
jgi:hypothetical protein